MNLDIMYFATYEEQEEIFKFIFSKYNIYVFKSGLFYEKSDSIINNFFDELLLCHRRVNGHNTYLFSFEQNVFYRQLKGETNYKYSLHSGSNNLKSFNVKTCSYENNMILFGRFDSVNKNIYELDEFFADLKNWMKRRYRKKNKYYVSNKILENLEDYRLIPVAANLQPVEGDFKWGK